MARRVRSLAVLALTLLACAALTGWSTGFAAPTSASVHHGKRIGVQALRQRPARVSVAAEASASSIGGQKTQAVMTAVISAVAIYMLTLANEVTKTCVGPLWAPPLGAIALIFGSAATAAADKGSLWSPQATLRQALQIAVALGGACTIAVALGQTLGYSALSRALSVALCSLWMAAVPVSSFFPPVGAFCVLYLDQVLANGPLAALAYKYAIFPCVTGTLFLFFATRAAALAVAPLLRQLQKSSVSDTVAS